MMIAYKSAARAGPGECGKANVPINACSKIRWRRKVKGCIHEF